jgi:hypothetical protein
MPPGPASLCLGCTTFDPARVTQHDRPRVMGYGQVRDLPADLMVHVPQAVRSSELGVLTCLVELDPPPRAPDAFGLQPGQVRDSGVPAVPERPGCRPLTTVTSNPYGVATAIVIGLMTPSSTPNDPGPVQRRGGLGADRDMQGPPAAVPVPAQPKLTPIRRRHIQTSSRTQPWLAATTQAGLAGSPASRSCA